MTPPIFPMPCTTHKLPRPLSLPHGPWDEEADKVHWIDPATDLDCLIVRNRAGALCGYVGIGPSHPCYKIPYEDVSLPDGVHGGLTYSDLCQENGKICHLPFPGREEHVWWLGFDCAHSCDLIPAYLHDPLFSFTKGPYRDLDYVKRECESLARQLKDLN
jgi:hypothetical protein